MGPPVITEYRGFRLVNRRGKHTEAHPTRAGMRYSIVAVMRGSRLIELFLDREAAKDWIDTKGLNPPSRVRK